jgi:hypothetical protein
MFFSITSWFALRDEFSFAGNVTFTALSNGTSLFELSATLTGVTIAGASFTLLASSSDEESLELVAATLTGVTFVFFVLRD